MRRALVIAGVVIACTDPRPVEAPQADPAELEAYVERSRVRPGETVTFRVVLEHDANLKIEMPSPDEDLGKLTVTDHGKTDDEPYPGRLRTVFWYRVKAEQAGVYELPVFRARYATNGETVELNTGTVFLEATDQRPNATEELKDIRVSDAPRSTLLWVYAAGASVPLIAALIWWLRRRKKIRPAATEPPEKKIRRRLNEIGSIDMTSPEGARRICFELTESLRDYVESLCELNATDLTTEEIASRLEQTWLPSDTQNEFTQVLSAADRVKFAGDAASEDGLKHLLDVATRFVDRAHRAPATEAQS